MQGKAAAIIVAAGQGSRAGGLLPKQYTMLGGLPVLAHSVRPLAAHPAIAQVVVVIGEGQEDWARVALASPPANLIFVTGGATRQLSVQAGLTAVRTSGDCDQVLIHDAARPFLKPAVIDRLLAALNHQRAAIPVLPVVDTLARCFNETLGPGVDRDSLYRVQTPQAFHFGVIWEAHQMAGGAADATDDAGLVRSMGHPVALVEGDIALEKLTHPSDFARAEANVLTSMTPRTGMGYDVHRLVDGKPLWLGGVEIAHDRGLSGHSDADVALHALVDALLGALAEGDIGTHFPPSEPQWCGAASHRFLSFARERVEARGARITHVDLTIICEAPKIGPYRYAIQSRIANLLALSIDRVSVKATTTERLGFTGRGEGIAAHAIATLLLPDL